MLPGPTLVRECPSCSGHVIETTMASGNTFGALFWPDGKMEAPMMPSYAAYVGCAHCKTSFWIENIKEVGRFSWGEKITDIFPDAIGYKEPTEEIFLQGLKEADLTKNKEIYLRSNLMRLYNDINRDQKVQRPATQAQIDNWKRLLEILGTEPTADKLLKGEVYREMGEFDKAEATLKGEFDEDYLQSLDILDELIKARDSRVMCINPEKD
jgi:hypothetical protein